MGFVDFAALMVTVIIIAYRHETGSPKDEAGDLLPELAKLA